jgi:uncharacterized membrane protein
MDVWTVIRFFHVAGLALFVGGQLALALAVAPALRGHDEAIMRAVARRFGVASGAALVIIIASGVAMASHFQRWGDGILNAKLAVLVLVFVLLGLHVVTPYARAISLAVLASSLLLVWLGINLAH